MKIRYMNPVCTWEDVQSMTEAVERVAEVLEHMQIGDREDASPELIKTREAFRAVTFAWRYIVRRWEKEVAGSVIREDEESGAE